MSCRFCNQTICYCNQHIVRTTSYVGLGRFCNQLIRNIATSFIAERIDLYVEYSSHEKIDRLGIPLFSGNKVYTNTILLTDENYLDIYNNAYPVNINPNERWFQTCEISQMIYDYFRKEFVKSSIFNKNPFFIRYENNNDCFVHVRLGDMANSQFNLGLKYYLKAISEVGNFEKLYVASDSPEHEIVQAILDTYPGKSEKVLLDEVETIQFGSTCRHIVLSHGSFSAVIGWLAFYSNIYYPEYESQMWHGDMFSVNSSWHKVVDYR